MKSYLIPTLFCLSFFCIRLWGQSPIRSITQLPATVTAQYCSKIAQFGSIFIFRLEAEYVRTSLWRVDANTGQAQQWSTPGVRAGEVQVGAEGLWWFEETLNGECKIQYGTADSARVQTVHRFEGFNNSFIGLVNNGVVAKAGQQIVYLPRQGNAKSIESWGEYSLFRPFSWQNKVFWFDPQRQQLFSYDGTGDQASSLGTFSSVDANLSLGSSLLFQTSEGWYRSDGTAAGTTLFFKPPSTDFHWTSAVLGDSVFLFTSLDLQQRQIHLWRSNGTTQGTLPFKTISDGGLYGLPDYFVLKNEGVYFIHWSDNFDRVIWQSDGTAAGTQPLDTLPQATLRQILLGKMLPSGQYALMVETFKGGLEPAIFDGSLRSYDLRKDGGSGLLRSDIPFNPVEWKDKVFLAANDGKTGLELWQLKVDGQAHRIGDLAQGGTWSFPCILGFWNQQLYWIAGATGTGAQIFQIDPDAQGDPNSAGSSGVEWFQSIEPALSPSATSFSAYMGGMTKSPNGLIYVTGAAENWRGQGITLTHGSLPQRPINSKGDHFLVQLDANGLPRWSQQIAGYNPLSSNGQVHVATAPDEGVYWAGLAWGSGQIGGQNYNFPNTTPLVARLSVDGKLLWALEPQLAPRSSVDALQSDAAGNLYIAGTFYNFNANIAGIPVSASSSPAYFMAKLNRDGQAIWVQSFSADGTWPALGPINDLALDPQGNLYALLGVGGQNYNASCDLGIVPGGVLRLDRSGNIDRQSIWSGNDYWYPTALDVSPQGNVYVSGLFRSTLNAGGLELRYTAFNCGASGFLVKMDQQLNVLAAQILDENQGKVAQSLKFDSQGNYYLAGYQEAPEFKIPAQYAHAPFSTGRQRVFVEAYSPMGELLAQRSFGVNEKFTEGGNIELQLLPDQKVLLLGEYRGMLDTFAQSSATLNDQSGYLIQFSLPFQFTPDRPDQQLADETVKISPNPAQDFSYVTSRDADLTVSEVKLYDALGRELKTGIDRSDFGVFRLNLTSVPKGVYQVLIQLGKERVVRSVVKM